MSFAETSEFSRIIRTDQVKDRDVEFSFHGEPAECARLAERFSLLGLDRLEARVWARRVDAAAAVRVRVENILS